MGSVLADTPSTPTATGMGESLNTGLTTNISANGIIEQFIDVLPWIGIMVGAAFLIYEARKLIKGAAKGKVRL